MNAAGRRESNSRTDPQNQLLRDDVVCPKSAFLLPRHYLIMDRDPVFTQELRARLARARSVPKVGRTKTPVIPGILEAGTMAALGPACDAQTDVRLRG